MSCCMRSWGESQYSLQGFLSLFFFFKWISWNRWVYAWAGIFLVFPLRAIITHLTQCFCEASGCAIGLGGQGKVIRCSNWGRQSRFWRWAGALEEIPGELCCAPYLNRADELAPFQGRVTRAERDLETRHDRDVCKRRGTFTEEEMTWTQQLNVWRAAMK